MIVEAQEVKGEAEGGGQGDGEEVITMNLNISDEQANEALRGKEQEAEKILKDKGQARKVLNKAEKLLDKIKKLPVIGKIADDVGTSIELITDFIDDKYRRVPTRVIVSALAGILYILSPIDLIPDFIPVVGWLDDVLVFSLILTMGLSAELKAYRHWKTTQEGEPQYNKIWPTSDDD